MFLYPWQLRVQKYYHFHSNNLTDIENKLIITKEEMVEVGGEGQIGSLGQTYIHYYIQNR